MVQTLAGHQISQQTADDLRYFLGCAQMESVGGRLWREALSDADRQALGGKFNLAFASCDRTVGMYRTLHPRVSLERAICEVLHELGMIPSPRYRRLVIAIGEAPDVPPEMGALPVWNAMTGELTLRGRLVRSVGADGTNLRAILDVLELLGWPKHVPFAKFELTEHEIRQAIYKLNRKATRLEFRTRKGLVWDERRDLQ